MNAWWAWLPRLAGDPDVTHDPRRFIAGAIISLVDRDEVTTHPDFRRKLEMVGFGFFIPVFFVTSGVRVDLGALTESASNLRRAPAPA